MEGNGARVVGLGERGLGIEEGDFNHEWERMGTNGEDGMRNGGEWGAGVLATEGGGFGEIED